MISVLGVLMGVDMQGFSGDDVPPEYDTKPSSSSSPTSPPTAPQQTSKPTPSKAAPPPPAEDVKMAEPEPEDEEAKVKAEALKEKAKGNELYKKRDFDPAIAAYERAWELWPKDVTFLTNLSGMS